MLTHVLFLLIGLTLGGFFISLLGVNKYSEDEVREILRNHNEK